MEKGKAEGGSFLLAALRAGSKDARYANGALFLPAGMRPPRTHVGPRRRNRPAPPTGSIFRSEIGPFGRPNPQKPGNPRFRSRYSSGRNYYRGFRAIRSSKLRRLQGKQTFLTGNPELFSPIRPPVGAPGYSENDLDKAGGICQSETPVATEFRAPRKRAKRRRSGGPSPAALRLPGSCQMPG